MPRRTALIVPVPEAAAYYASDVAIPAHVTILFPFLEPDRIDEGEVASFVAGLKGFDFVLDRVDRFPEGVAWLHPEPSQPFAAMTEAVYARWPGYPPYEGAHTEVIPHLTITVDEDVPKPPIACRAREVLLLEEEERGGRWATRLRIPLR